MNKGQNKIFPKHLFHLDQKSQDLWDFAAGAFVFRGIGAYEIVGPPASRNPGIRIGGMSDINTNFFGRKIPKDQQKLPTKKSSKKKGLMLPSCFLDVLTFFLFAALVDLWNSNWASPTLVPAGITSPTRKPQALCEAKEREWKTSMICKKFFTIFRVDQKCANRSDFRKLLFFWKVVKSSIHWPNCFFPGFCL